MDKNEVTARIYEHMQEIRKLVEDFSPENKYLSLTVLADGGRIMFNNAHWEFPAEERAEKRIDFYEWFEEDEE